MRTKNIERYQRIGIISHFWIRSHCINSVKDLKILYRFQKVRSFWIFSPLCECLLSCDVNWKTPTERAAGSCSYRAVQICVHLWTDRYWTLLSSNVKGQFSRYFSKTWSLQIMRMWPGSVNVTGLWQLVLFWLLGGFGYGCLVVYLYDIWWFIELYKGGWVAFITGFLIGEKYYGVKNILKCVNRKLHLHYFASPMSNKVRIWARNDCQT